MTPAETIEDYRATWEGVMTGAQPVEALAGFFHVPCLMLSIAGELETCADPPAIRAFNDSRRVAFANGGAVQALLRGVDVTSQGPHLALATVNWELRRADGSTERAWRHYYTLRRKGENWSILVSTFQTGA